MLNYGMLQDSQEIQIGIFNGTVNLEQDRLNDGHTHSQLYTYLTNLGTRISYTIA